MNPIRTEFSAREEIESLGFKYTDQLDKCRLHMFNNVSLKIDLRDEYLGHISAAEIEENIDTAFMELVVKDLREAGVKAINKVYWDKWFLIGEEWDVRKFTVKFYLRILGEDAEVSGDNHVCRA